MEELLSSLNTKEDNLHIIYHFLFSVIKEGNWGKVEELITNPNTLQLKEINLVAILCITYQYKDSINSYDLFFEQAKENLKNRMDETDFTLTFNDFNG